MLYEISILSVHTTTDLTADKLKVNTYSTVMTGGYGITITMLIMYLRENQRC